jgi:hypothetical protein
MCSLPLSGRLRDRPDAWTLFSEGANSPETSIQLLETCEGLHRVDQETSHDNCCCEYSAGRVSHLAS